MPHFYFDMYDDGRCTRDEIGIDLPDVNRVWEIAIPMVDEIAKSKQHLHPPYSIYVVVRNSADVVVYETRHLVRVGQAMASVQAPDAAQNCEVPKTPQS